MDDKLKQRLKATGMLASYGFALYHAGANLEKAGSVNDLFDGRAAMLAASNAVGSSTVSHHIDLTPHTTIDKQFFNADADYELNHDNEEQT
jgi:hypothetical protein